MLFLFRELSYVLCVLYNASCHSPSVRTSSATGDKGPKS